LFISLQDIVNENGFVLCSYTFALHSSWPGYKWEQNISGLIRCFLIHIISALMLQLFMFGVQLGI